MELGPHAEEVLEIVELVESGVIFRDPRPPRDPALIIIHDMAEAQKYRFTEPDPRYDGPWEWRELLEFAGDPDQRDEIYAKDHDVLYSVPGLVDSLLKLMEERIGVALDRQLGDEYPENDILYIYGSFDFILSLRATNGRTLPFIERLVRIYRLGGHPCGWSGPCPGARPGGRLVAYFPPRHDRGGRLN